MLLRRLKLVNYGGIYNGMGRTHIEIDFTKCKNRIILLRGDNGSGKSTIERSLKPLPDDNKEFIPGKTAFKEIEYFDEYTNIIYFLQFEHPININNGERLTTKGHVYKINLNDGSQIDLNPSGNISSCRDIIYEEFQLDPNYISLCQLSTNKRGLADQRPADRKKYVNSILTSTEVYNNIYKTLNKKSSTYKGLMQTIISKINSIGNVETIEMELVSLNNKIKDISRRNTEALKTKSAAEGSIREINPDLSFFERVDQYNINLEQYRNALNLKYKDAVKLSNFKSNKYEDLEFPSVYPSQPNNFCLLLEAYIKDIDDKAFSLESLKRDHENKIDSLNKEAEALLKDREVDAAELQAKTTKLEAITNGTSYSQAIEMKKNYEERMKYLKEHIGRLDIDIESMTQEDFECLYINLIEIKNKVAEYCRTYGDITIEYLKGIDNTKFDESIVRLKEDKRRVEDNIRTIEMNTDLAKVLDKKPANCENVDCPFIKTAMEASKKIKNLLPKRNYELELARIEADIRCREFLKEIKIALRSNYATIAKIPVLDEPVKNIITGDLTHMTYFLSKKTFDSYMNIFSTYLDGSNNFEEYKKLKEAHTDICYTIRSLKSQAEFVEILQKDISNIRKKLDEDVKKMEAITDERNKRSKDIEVILEDIDYLNKIKSACIEMIDLRIKISELEKYLDDNKTKISKYNEYKNIIKEAADVIVTTDRELTPLLNRRESLKYNMSIAVQYNKELAEFKTMFDKVETLKKYSSPTKNGIQMVFIGMYLNKMLDKANEILSTLFGGIFTLLPFNITETEFNIPVAVEGGLNHMDVSSMSSAQIALISMVISISLLSQTSTKLNIIVGDEIDAPFDGHNRLEFFNVLYSLMNLINATQCVLISHNTELPQSECDVILLKNDNGDISVPGNIIWSYYDEMK